MKLRPGQLLCIAAILLVGLNLRPALAVISPLIETIRAATGLSYQAMGWVTGLPIMAMGFLALAGSTVYRLGMRRGVAIGILLVFAACLLRLLATDPAWLLGSALLAGIGIGITQTLVPGFIKQHFPQQIDTLMALYVSMIMGGAAMSAAGTPILLHSMTWEPALAMWALPALLGLVLWLLATRAFRDPARRTVTAATSAAAASAVTVLRPWRHARAWLLAGLFCASGSCYTLALAWLAPYYIELGASPQRAGLLLAGCTLLASAGYLMLAWIPLAAPWLIIAILGLGIGALFPLTLILAMDHASVPRNAGVLAAFVQGIGYLVAGLLPFAAGQLRDSLGSLESAWSLMAGVVLLSLILIRRASPASAKAFDQHCRQG